MENQRIEQILERMEKNQNDFFEKMLALLARRSAKNEDWIDSVEVQKILNITRKTVYRLIVNETLKPERIGRRNYFLKSEIFDLRKRFLK